MKYLSERQQAIGKGLAVTTPITLDPVPYEGTVVYGDDGGLYVSRRNVPGEVPTDVVWRPVASDGIAALAAPIAVSVGSGGDFTELQDALAYLAGFTPSVTTNRFLCTVTLLTGYSPQVAIQMRGVNLAWVIVESVDAVVEVSITAVAPDLDGADQQLCFIQAVDSVLPQLNCVFHLDNASWTGTYGQNVSALGVQIIGVSLRTSVLYTPYYDNPLDRVPRGVTNFSQNLFVAQRSLARIDNSDFSEGKLVNVYVTEGSYAVLLDTVVTGSNSIGVHALIQGCITLQGGTNTRNNGVSDDSADITVNAGGIVNINGGSVLGGICQQPFVPTLKGIIYDQRYTDKTTWAGLIAPEVYTVATTPVASANTGKMIYVSNGNSGSPCFAMSNGTNWLRITPGAAVST